MDSTSPDIEVVMDFLSQLFEKGLGYSCINSARSALSTFININNNPVGQHPLVVRLMKGIFNKRANLPKNNITWDPEIVLNYLKTLSPVGKLNLINLSIKTVALITSRPFLKTAGGIVLGSVAVSAVSADVLLYISVAIKASFLKLGMCNICKNNIAKMFLDFFKI